MNLLPTEQRAEVEERVHVLFSLPQIYKALVHLKSTESTEMTPAWSGQIPVPTERQGGQETHSPFSLQTALCRKTPPTHTVPRRPAHIASCSVGTGILISASSHSSPDPGLPARSFQLSDHHYVFPALCASFVLKILLIFYSLGNQHSERLCI